MASIFYFIENYVPKRIFDLELASQQQKACLQAVQDGHKSYVIRAPRKGGKTILVAIIAVWLTLRDQTFRFFIVSGSEAQAKWLYDYCRDILQPSSVDFGDFKERRAFFRRFLKREPKNQITEYKAGGWIMYTAATSKKVNAPTSDAVGMDEFVLIPNQIVEEAWPMNRSSKNPMRFLLSTATDGKENTDAFIDILEDCDPGKPLHKLGWLKFEWTTEDAPHLITAAARKDAESAAYFLSDDMYHTQYEGGLPKRAGRIFPRTFIREAFVAPDPDNPGFLLDGTPYNPEDPNNPGFLVDGTSIEIKVEDKPWVMRTHGLEFQGDSKGGIDWGFDHDTVFLEGYRGLGGKMCIMKMVIGNGTSPSDWADQAEDDALEYNIHEWYADASGAFQNQEIKERGFRVVARAFQRQARGKEWMIGISYFWLSKRKIVIPDTEEFAPLKRQLLKWKRGSDGKPKKGDDHCCDAFICLMSAWEPRYYDEDGTPIRQPETKTTPRRSSNDWNEFQSGDRAWMPDNWRNNPEMRKEPWEK